MQPPKKLPSDQRKIPTTGTEPNNEVETFREQLRKEGKTEQQINVAVAQLQVLGELPIE